MEMTLKELAFVQIPGLSKQSATPLAKSREAEKYYPP
tara:strand:- start:9908 stop:10018 length:111 start_codon:yes stop_codon:yes gene_type:complete